MITGPSLQALVGRILLVDIAPCFSELKLQNRFNSCRFEDCPTPGYTPAHLRTLENRLNTLVNRSKPLPDPVDNKM